MKFDTEDKSRRKVGAIKEDNQAEIFLSGTKETSIFPCVPEKNSYSPVLYGCHVEQPSGSDHLWNFVVLIRQIDHFLNTWTEGGVMKKRCRRQGCTRHTTAH